MQSKDGLERLAISQLLVTHGRVMWLSKLLTEQTNTKAITAISASIDSALSTFVRLIRAIDEYRRPRGPDTSVSIGQANVATIEEVIGLLTTQGDGQRNASVRNRIHKSRCRFLHRLVPLRLAALIASRRPTLQVMSWLLKQFCQHPHQIMRKREKEMGLECTSCFHWTQRIAA